MNSVIPDTRHSLILRLQDSADVEAWDQFVAIYEPLVYRLARGKGLQDADAREVVQEVMVAVSGAVSRWQPDAELGRFRDWLFRISRNLVINFLTRRKHRSLGSGDSRIAALLHEQCDTNHPEASRFDLAYRREVFSWAAQQVRRRVTAQTWDAFALTALHEQSVADAANTLKMSVGAVHIARSRVLGRLRQIVQTFEASEGTR